jgi:hypothetical protein
VVAVSLVSIEEGQSTIRREVVNIE